MAAMATYCTIPEALACPTIHITLVSECIKFHIPPCDISPMAVYSSLG